MFRLLIFCTLWIAVDGYKVARCQPFQGPRNGQVSYTVREGGLVARFRCRRGYKLVGSPFAVCLGGIWRHSVPNCLPETNTLEQEELPAEKRRSEPMTLALRNKSGVDESVQNDSPIRTELLGFSTPRRKYRKVTNQTKKKKDKRKLKQRTKSKGSLVDGQSLEQDDDFLSKLDLSCLVGGDGTGFIKAPEISNAVVKYARRRNERKSQNRYLLATYECVKGFSLKNKRNDRMFCSHSRWLGSKPKCHRQEVTEEKALESSLCAVNRGGCEHVCTENRKRITCSCYHGFRSEGNRCIDVDECEIDNGGCEHTCRNQLGSFSCSCPKGLQLSSNGKTCLDINECLSRNGHGPCQDTCTNHWGGYRCGCEGIPGTQLSEDNHTCEHLDECKSGMAGCSHSCINALGRAFCQCPPGLELGEDWKTCQDVDECDDEIIENTCEFGCINTVGSYHCADAEKENDITLEPDITSIDNCSAGYRRDSEGKCLDIDECTENLHNCSYRCVNREGDYECLCPDGYDLNDNERTCDDYDECAEDLDTEHNCSQRCINEIGGYRCDCYNGYYLDADLSTCADVDECISSPCAHECINTIGGFRCGCPEGFQVENQTKCIDVNECLSDRHNCSHECTNTLGAYVCTCPSGMSLSDDKFSCVDIDECEVDNGNCMHICSNKLGGHQCECFGGYRLENFTACVDIDECSDGSNPCSHTCINTPGSYFCQCPEGYTLRQEICEDIDECLQSNGNCSHFCTNLQGSYNCSCPNGFELNDFGNCKDIDECLIDNGNCSHVCKNYEGSFECECSPGYELREIFTCKDIDECISIDENNGGCSGTCENTDGSFICGCPEGYALEPNGKTCQDINECDTDNGNCSHICINLDGSYRCSCPNNLKLEDNLTCTEMDLCLIDNGGCEQMCEMVNGSRICSCFEGYRIRSENNMCDENENCFGCDENCDKMNNNVACPCRERSGLKQNQGDCVDIDECENTPCQQICINTKGSYKCDCHDGYRLNDRDNKTCLDVDECLEWEYDFEYYDAKLEDGDIIGESKNLCSHTCVNLPGGYTCYCPKGYVLHEDDRTCVDLNECEKDNGGCDHLCINFDGGYSCECRPGFHLKNNKTCVDVDECSLKNGNCTQICENTIGGFLCSCNEGYQMDQDNRTCKRDCSVRNGLCSAFCFDTGGVPRCDCPLGFELQKDNLSCEDVNECLLENGGCAQECRNTIGSFLCSCKEGYVPEGNGCSPINGCSKKNGQCSHFCSYDNGYVACSCPKGYLLSGDNKTCICPSGYFENGNDCQDVDECKEGNGNCSGLCINTLGGYRCECPSGFQLHENGKSCEDVNECVRDNGGGCAHDCVNTIGSYFCKCGNGFTLENRTHCTPKNMCEIQNGGCAQICNSENGKVRCSCRQGYVKNGTNCEDIDECMWNHDCTQICINTVGSYQCKCKPGYRLDAGNLCKDINECVIQRPCQEICINTLGSYKCVCPIGFKEEHGKCKDINECEFENGNCSHKCINVQGSFKCICPSGYEMQNSSCKDINECDKYNGGCDHICLNNEGSYTCNCRDNYYLSEDGKTCRSFGKTCSKLKVPNYGEVRCPQFPQSTEKFPVYAECYIRCHKGYKLIGDVQHVCMSSGEWSGRDSECIPLPCPKLKAPENGHFIPSTCTTVKSPPSHHCILACNKGYHVQGRAVLTCLTSQQWNSPIPTCSKDTPPPYIQCSQDIKVELPSKKPSVYVKIPQPKSNVDWWRYVEAHPPWAKQLEGEFLLGTTTIMFQARNPNSNVTAACRLLIHVYDNEKPRVVECPDSFVVKLSAKEAGKIITWKEPTFSDNVKIKHIDKSKEPGSLFKVGHHSIRYTATDTSGNQAICHFTITVRQEDEDSRTEDKDSFKRFIICPNSIADHEFYSSYLIPARCFVQRHRLTKVLGGFKEHQLLQDHGVRHRHDFHDIDVGTAKNRSAAEKMIVGEEKFPKKSGGQQRKTSVNDRVLTDRPARHRGNFPSDFRKIGTPFVDPRDLIDQKSHQSDLARWQDMVKKFQTSALPSAVVAGRDSDVRLVELETRRRLEEERLRNHEAEMMKWRENMKKYHVEMKRLQQGSRQQRTG